MDYKYITDANCGLDSFQCSDGSCISLSLLCNFQIDCKDGEDEITCGNYSSMPSEIIHFTKID